VSARILTTLFLLGSTLLAGNANAQRLDINLNQTSARFTYTNLVGGSTFGRTEMNTGLLYNEDSNLVINVDLQVIDAAGSKTPGLELGVGPRFYYLTHDDSDSSAAAIALGGQLRYKLPNVPRLSFAGVFFYAPSITSTLDANNMNELGFGASYELLPTADIYIKYRRIRSSFTAKVGSRTIDSGTVIGMRFSF